jgi:hypothetical protein
MMGFFDKLKAQNQKWFCAFSFYSTAFGFFVEKPRCIVSL